MKKLKMLISIIAAVFLIFGTSVVTVAVVPYKSYNYNAYGTAVETADIYQPTAVLTGNITVGEGFANPSDMYIKNDALFVLDSGNNRVVVYQMKTGQYRNIFPVQDQKQIDVSKATGIYVDSGDRIFIADSGNSCVWVTDSDGKILTKITKPENDYFEGTLDFLPRKVTGDTVGNLYVQCTGVYEGLIIFNENYKFSGFFGSEKVQTTAQILKSFFWKQFMTAEQKETMANYVPTEIYNMDMSSDNFLFTITPGSLAGGDYCKQSPDSIRCLNPKGSDVLEASMPKDVQSAFENDNRYLNFIDIAYSEDGFINVIDNRQARIYHFDKNMQLVSAFGGVGEYRGDLKQPIAVECYEDRILVLDAEKNSVTVYSPTQLGTIVHTALMLYNDGKYSESMSYWKQVIEDFPDFQLAYIGIGNALYNDGKYKEAMDYYETARDSVGYGNAYREYRVISMRKNFVWVLLAVIILVGILKSIGVFLRKKGIAPVRTFAESAVGLRFYSAFHPVTGFDRIKSRKTKSVGFMAIIYVLLVLLGVCEKQYMGKSFIIADASQINIISIALVRLALILLFAIANWAFGELASGKATFEQILTLIFVAVIPYMIGGYIRVLLSHFLTQNESVFLSITLAVGIIGSFIVLMSGFSVFHEYEFGKSLLTFLVTVIGIALIVILGFLVYNLTQNVIDFVKTVFSELIFRLNT